MKVILCSEKKGCETQVCQFQELPVLNYSTISMMHDFVYVTFNMNTNAMSAAMRAFVAKA